MLNPRPRILFYARGGGLGHFNRAYAIARQLLRLQTCDCLIATTSALAPLVLQPGIEVLRWPGAASPWSAGWLRLLPELLAQLQPDLLVVDTFPQGPENELEGLDWPRLWIQRDADLSAVAEASLSESVPLIQAWPEADGLILNRQPQELLPRARARQGLGLPAGSDLPLVLIAHNGDPFETPALMQRLLTALEPLPLEIRLASRLPCPRPEWQSRWLTHYPLSEYLRGVDLVIGGGGYNLVAEARAYGLRSLHLAFERPIDKQWQRIQNLPHLESQDSAETIRASVQTLLKQAPPAPEVACQGALIAAQRICDWLSGAAK